MKKCSRWGRKCIWNGVFFLITACLLAGCGRNDNAAVQEETDDGRQTAEISDGSADGPVQAEEIPGESAARLVEWRLVRLVDYDGLFGLLRG